MKSENFSNHEILLSWTAKHRCEHTRNKGWYAKCIGVLVFCAAYSILIQSWSFLFVLTIATAVYAYTHRLPVGKQTVRITRDGIWVEDDLSRWEECKSFWFLQGDGYTELHISRKKNLIPDIVVRTGDKDYRTIQGVLEEYLEIDPHRKEKLFDTIIRICKL